LSPPPDDSEVRINSEGWEKERLLSNPELDLNRDLDETCVHNFEHIRINEAAVKNERDHHGPFSYTGGGAVFLGSRLHQIGELFFVLLAPPLFISAPTLWRRYFGPLVDDVRRRRHHWWHFKYVSRMKVNIGLVGALTDFLLRKYKVDRSPVLLLMCLFSVASLFLYYKFGGISIPANVSFMTLAGIFIGGAANIISSAVAADLGQEVVCLHF
jgi:hypothetical protein